MSHRSAFCCFMLSMGLVALAGCGSHRGTLQTVDTTSQRVVQEAVTQVRAKYQLPALAVTVVRAEGTPIVAVSGSRRADVNRPANAEDRFNIGSCGKAMTGTLIAGLVQAGKLRYEMTLGSLFPELTTTMTPAYRNVTLAQLLEMRAGLAPYTTGEEVATLPDVTGTIPEQRQQLSLYLLSHPVSVTPGTYQYSNASYLIAAAIAEKATGKDWESLMREYVYGPLGMSQVHYGPAGKDDVNGEPWGHQLAAGSTSWTPISPTDEPDLPAAYPTGDQNMPLGDWGRFLQAHLRGLQGKSTGLPLKISAFAGLHAGEAGTVSRGGWVPIPGANGTASYFAGSTGTFDSEVFLIPSRNIAIAVVANASDEEKPNGSVHAAEEELIARVATALQP